MTTTPLDTAFQKLQTDVATLKSLPRRRIDDATFTPAINAVAADTTALAPLIATTDSNAVALQVQVAALQAQVLSLQAQLNSPPSTSPDGTIIVPGQGSITDSSGNIFTIDAQTNIYINGSRTTAQNWQSTWATIQSGLFVIHGLDSNYYQWQNGAWTMTRLVAMSQSPQPLNANLLQCSNEFDTATWTKSGGTTAAPGLGPVQISIPAIGPASLNQASLQIPGGLNPSTTYTLSWLASPVSGTAKLRIFLFTAALGNQFSSDFTINGLRQSYTFTTPASILNTDNFGFTEDAAGDATTFNLSKVKLELGSVATNYTGDTNCPHGLIPAHVFGLYYWVFGGSPTVASIQSTYPKFNFLYGFVAQGSGVSPSFGAPYTGFDNDIAAWKASSGRIVVLTIGGAGVSYTLDTDAHIDSFTNNLIPIIDAHGFQGIDVDLEGLAAFGVSTEAAAAHALVRLGNNLKSHYGPAFIYTFVPQPGGNNMFNGVGTPYYDAAVTLGANIDLIAPQYYDQGNIDSVYNTEIINTDNQAVAGGIGASKMMMGMAALGGSSSGRMSTAGYLSTYTSEVSRVGIRGVFVYNSSVSAANLADIYNAFAPSFPAITDFYVSKLGLDTNPGTKALPFLTITKGVNSCKAGQSVSVDDGTYTENISVTANGAQFSPITIFALNGLGHVTIQGTGAVAGSAWSGAVIQPSNWNGDDSGDPTASGNQYIVWDGFTVTTPTALPNQVLGFRCSTGWQVLNCIIQNMGGGTNTRGQNVVINNTIVKNIEGTNAHAHVAAGGDGTTAPKLQGYQCVNGGWNHINTQNLTNSGNSAVHKILGSTGAIIKGLVIDTCTGSGIWFDGATPPNDTMQISHCKFSNCHDYGIQLESNPTSNAHLFNNDFTNCGNTGASGQTGAIGINETQDVEIDHNAFKGGNIQSISWRNGSHPTVVERIKIHDNWFNDGGGQPAIIDGPTDPNYTTPAGANSTMDTDTFGPNSTSYIQFGGNNATSIAQCISLFNQENNGTTSLTQPPGTGA